ncbi:M48 family metallopeptidase [Roseibacterium beibuensis]|uniref:M48 family metallopeptidase n=1 Tax=[Roseibacterium] beibuensis TaxID=1193142 RepID=UPI00217F01C1|nr:M48 family metallopeptidase [Roseibacterium beibuensis]MCS6627384.1 M48 family metallopeptidase [Roseibacterium beibuensis]
MRAPARLIAAASLAFVLAAGACGHPAPDAGAALLQDAPAVRLERLNSLDVRVADVAWTLALANADLCPVNRPRAGWTLQSASQYGAELRPLAEARYGLSGDLPGVLAAPPESPAATAGLAAGDLIVAVNGLPLAEGAAPAEESYDGLQANAAVLDAALARGPAVLTVRRAGVEREVTVRPVSACAYPAQVEVTGSFRSRTDGRHIFISDGMANLAQNEDELAFVLAHELAHAVLEHRTQPDVTGVRGGLNWALSMRRGLSLSAEADADRLGLFLVARAGFDPVRAVEFLTRYEAADGGAGSVQINAGGIYESAAGRRRALQPVLEDIAARQAAGRALIP